ncbi:hypothetical protein EOPP23_20930 [Endozoicomonas sp. OPT23]|nr:hypothetical protein [Endozoicomonas sp. OPT23]
MDNCYIERYSGVAAAIIIKEIMKAVMKDVIKYLQIITGFVGVVETFHQNELTENKLGTNSGVFHG